MGVDSYVVSAEDSILSKIEWSKLSESDRQLNDSIETCRVNSRLLEISYLKTWAQELGLADVLSNVLDTSGLK